jgi:hypothetical protein
MCNNNNKKDTPVMPKGVVVVGHLEPADGVYVVVDVATPAAVHVATFKEASANFSGIKFTPENKVRF